jgi:hypothetical protein
VRSTDNCFASRRKVWREALNLAWLLGFASQLRNYLLLDLFFGLTFFGSGIPSTKQTERLAIRTQSSRSGCIPSSSIKPWALTMPVIHA